MHWLRSEDLKEEKNVTASTTMIAALPFWRRQESGMAGGPPFGPFRYRHDWVPLAFFARVRPRTHAFAGFLLEGSCGHLFAKKTRRDGQPL